ncbi:murein hydrolase activator NlpD [Vibrio mimicus]|uniref:murein hydrolase activator NlpD n=1 Tax=Vibrio mimicus TaxID=674 RepID=UPI0011D384FA|nr:murein hydrolase activator NlpD [Vibrio mimicus]TXY15244.1 murein hydrolase activator NlpD [Vibrio mimicus]
MTPYSFRLVLLLLSSLLFGCAAQSPAPVSGLGKDYNTIERGSYRGSYYEVKKGDTLYFIAYLTDKDVNDLISYNDLAPPYTIHPGQKLKLWLPNYTPPAYGGTGGAATVAAASSLGSAAGKTAAATTAAQSVSKSSNAKNAQKGSNNSQNMTKKDPVKAVDQTKTKEYVEPVGKQNVNVNVANAKPSNEKIAKWLWPTKGRVIKNFSAGDQGNKGIDIAGQRGQAVVATAEGIVVYSGNALRGYGNLIIIKHNEHYLSAYAHNDQLLAKEGQTVQAGQKIATMGSSGTNSVRLHFEIRYQGKSVNPKRYLP